MFYESSADTNSPIIPYRASLLRRLFCVGSWGCSECAASDRDIHFPDVEGYQTLVLDLHTHSVFSDGHVWPTIRVAEAERDGLDGIAVTEHLEWQPHLLDIPHPDRNRSFDVATLAAEKLDLLIIPGIEITRSDEAGHMNAVFIQDANALVRQRGADTYLPAHQFADAAQAIAFAKAASAGAFSEAHPVEIDGSLSGRLLLIKRLT